MAIWFLGTVLPESIDKIHPSRLAVNALNVIDEGTNNIKLKNHQLI